MKIEQDIKLDFSDVLMRPKRSTLSSRSEVDLIRTLKFPNSGQSWSGVPIMVANMDTVGTLDMFNSLYKNRMMTCLHKYVSAEDIIELFKQYEGLPDDELHPSNYMILSTGITESNWDNLNSTIAKLSENGIEVKFICVDVANGYMESFSNFCKRVRSEYPDKTIIAGNVVTREIVEELILNCGVDIVKCGIGSGSVCTTRLQTGVGMPQFSTILECADAAHGLNGHIISDGGVKVPGDFSKAFAGGADFVMSGSMFAGFDESAGDLVTDEDGRKFKTFYGMSSATSMNKYHGGVAKHRSSEGKTVKVPYKGPVQDQVYNILGGIRSTCTYTGAKRLKDLPKCATFIRVNNQVNNKYSHEKFMV